MLAVAPLVGVPRLIGAVPAVRAALDELTSLSRHGANLSNGW